MSWIDSVLSETSEAEAPENYIYWAALTAIAATVRNRVWINKGGLYKLYPNIYVFLIGKSGLRKGFPVSLARNLVEGLEVTRVISGRMTIQGLVKDLATAYTLPTGGIIKDACCFLASGEYASFIVEDPAAIYIMTDLHDTHAHEKGWINRLASDASRVLEKPCMTVLGASNEINLAETLPKVAHGGGLVARTFIVHAERKRKINPLLEEGKPIDFNSLRGHLSDIARCEGPFKVTRKAIDYYTEWYVNKEKVAELNKVEDPTGTLERIHDQILKLSMLLSLAESTNMIVDRCHIELAVLKATECVPSMQRLMMSTGKTTEIGAQTKIVLRRLLAAPEHKMTRKKLLQNGYGEYDAYDLDRIAETLIQADWIKITKRNGEAIYTMQDFAVEFFEKGSNNV